MTDGYATFRWEQLARRQKLYIGAAVVLLAAVFAYGVYDRFRLWSEIRVYERERIEAGRQAQEALLTAEKIAREKVEVEKQLAEKESKRDGKVTEVEAARVKVLDDRLELNRAVRERRTDNPSAEQLCAELKSLGYPCS